MTENIEECLHAYNNFGECILLDYWSANLCRDFRVSIDNIWAPGGGIRADLDRQDRVEFLFVQCRNIDIRNDFEGTTDEDDPAANWSMSEFALLGYSELADGWLKFEFIWESDVRSISVICKSVLVFRSNDLGERVVI